MSSTRPTDVPVELRVHQMADYIQHVLSFDVRQGHPVRLEKMAAFSTSPRPGDQ